MAVTLGFLLLRSRVGASLQAIRDDEEAAASVGVRVLAGDAERAAQTFDARAAEPAAESKTDPGGPAIVPSNLDELVAKAQTAIAPE